MADETLELLTRFHREFRDEFATFRRDVTSLVQSEFGSVRAEVTEMRSDFEGLRGDMLSHFDSVYERFDRLEKEYYTLLEAVRGLEKRFETIGKGFADRQELEELKARIAELQERVTQLEAEL